MFRIKQSTASIEAEKISPRKFSHLLPQGAQQFVSDDNGLIDVDAQVLNGWMDKSASNKAMYFILFDAAKPVAIFIIEKIGEHENTAELTCFIKADFHVKNITFDVINKIHEIVFNSLSIDRLSARHLKFSGAPKHDLFLRVGYESDFERQDLPVEGRVVAGGESSSQLEPYSDAWTFLTLGKQDWLKYTSPQDPLWSGLTPESLGCFTLENLREILSLQRTNDSQLTTKQLINFTIVGQYVRIKPLEIQSVLDKLTDTALDSYRLKRAMIEGLYEKALVSQLIESASDDIERANSPHPSERVGMLNDLLNTTYVQIPVIREYVHIDIFRNFFADVKCYMNSHKGEKKQLFRIYNTLFNQPNQLMTTMSMTFPGSGALALTPILMSIFFPNMSFNFVDIDLEAINYSRQLIFILDRYGIVDKSKFNYYLGDAKEFDYKKEVQEGSKKQLKTDILFIAALVPSAIKKAIVNNRKNTPDVYMLRTVFNSSCLLYEPMFLGHYPDEYVPSNIVSMPRRDFVAARSRSEFDNKDVFFTGRYGITAVVSLVRKSLLSPQAASSRSPVPSMSSYLLRGRGRPETSNGKQVVENADTDPYFHFT